MRHQPQHGHRWIALLLATALALTPSLALAHDGLNRRTNAFRVDNGLPALRVSDNLDHLARIRARQIVGTFSHEFWWLNHTSCAVGGEVIAWRKPALPLGQRAPWFMEVWEASPEHRAMMLGLGWRRMGSAIHIANGVMYGVELFCDPR